MTDIDQPIPSSEEVRRTEVQAYLNERMQWVDDAMAVVAPENSGDPRDVFALASEVRDEAENLPLSADQETELREVAGRFGIGGEQDVLGAAKVRVKEGGKVWKAEAELAISGNDETPILSGSPNRRVGQDEVDHLQEKYGLDIAGKTEFEMMRVLAGLQEGFVHLEEDEVLPFGYDINDDFALIQEETGQLVKIGERNGQPVMLLRVDRENFTGDDGEPKYRNQPDSAAIMTFVGNVLTACGDKTSSVGMDTSTTYASRVVDTVRAGLKSGRAFDVGMYGRQTLADVRNQPVAEPSGINQIPGELRAMYEKLAALEVELGKVTFSPAEQDEK